MNVLAKFFGKREDNDGKLIANAGISDPLSLQLLLNEPLDFNFSHLRQALQAYHPSMADCKLEIDKDLMRSGHMIALIGWGQHVISLVGFSVPMPGQVVESCVAPSHYPEYLKQNAYNHKTHMYLYYTGYEQDPLEHYIAMAAVAGVLSDFGVSVVLNEAGKTSLPAGIFKDMSESDHDAFELLRSLPLASFYCGFVKYEVEGTAGVWMRSYGGEKLNLPNLSVLAEGHHEGEKYFDMFSNVLDYIRVSGADFEIGHTMQLGEDAKEFFRFRAPQRDEYFLDDGQRMLVLERVPDTEIH